MKPNVIFFGNGPLADSALEVLSSSCNILFHARTKEDLETVKSLKASHKDALGILASFGVLIKSDILDLFEPEGILNIHPSLLPLYRGASPIESAIIAGDNDFSVSIMKLVKAMDAGPIYHQETISNLPLDKSQIYQTLATHGASWIAQDLNQFSLLHKENGDPSALFPDYHLQDDKKATFTSKITKNMATLTPEKDTAFTTLRKIIAYQGYPKPRCTIKDQEVIILSAHEDNAPSATEKDISIKCSDGSFVVIDRLQPLSRKPMDAKSFLNGLHSR